ncbi:MAG TPA: class I SAM-dependent methyltransferase [Bryobacteraceae bacterium]|nr:class I SAM-dependent methyltransferase [Bryobacteraceae bacterium]
MLSNTLFDRGAEYDQMLMQGLRFSGENHEYFLRGRIHRMLADLDSSYRPRRILDFGCGIGHATQYLTELFPDAEVIGMDTSEPALEYARGALSGRNARFTSSLETLPDAHFDLCYTNGTFHHIEPSLRIPVVNQIRRVLSPKGLFAFFENNPWNPGTRLVMRSIPFDRDAVPLPPPEAKGLLGRCGFTQCQPATFLFYFPRQLAPLRRLEPALARIPLGAQYYLLARS